MHVLVIDFETSYGQPARWVGDTPYTLSSMTTEAYCRDPRFQTIGVGIRNADNTARVWLEHDQFKAWAASVDWNEIAVIAHHCVKGDVEVLGRHGWHRLDGRLPGEIAQWDPATNEITFTPYAPKVFDYSGELVCWDSQFHSCAYTPNHRMYVGTPDRKQWFAESAEEVASRQPNNVYIPLGGWNKGGCLPFTPEIARLMEAVRADGNIEWASGTAYARFHLRKERKIERLLGLLNALGISYRRSSVKTNGMTVVRTHVNGYIQLIAEQLGPTKQYGPWVLDLNPSAQQAILDEVQHWDGSQKKGSATGFTFSTVDRDTAEWLQILFHLNGYRCRGKWSDNCRGLGNTDTHKPLFVAGVRKVQRAKLVRRASKEQYVGKVYCVTVPTGAFVVRSEGRVFVTGNSHFDGLILSHHYGVKPRFWFDTLSMANALRPHNRKSLAKLAELEGIGKKGEEVILAKGKRREDFTPQEWAQYGVYCLNDCDLEFALYDLYVRQFDAIELRVMDFTIRQFTEPTLTMNREVLALHHQSEIDRKRALLEKCGADKADLMSNPKFAQLLIEYGVEPPMKWSEKQTKTAREKDPDAPAVFTFAFAKSDPGMKDLLDHDNPEVRTLAEARVGVKSTIEETRALRYMGIVDRGFWPVYIAYHKAHTGRAAGGDKSNAQNLKRGGILRDAIEAPPGHKIAVADSAQIEARVLALVACQTDLVKAFAQGRDIYSEDASEIFNRPVDRKRKVIVDGKETFPDFIPGFIAKTQRLGLGFQMWWPKFASTMLAGAMGGPPVQFGREMLEQMQIDFTSFVNNPKDVNTALSIPTRLSDADMIVHCIVAKHLVRQYREKNKAIVSFWEVCSTAIEAMYRGSPMTFGFQGVFKAEKGAVLLPSGRRLYYPDLAYDVRNAGKKNQRFDWTYWNGTERTKIYGGLFTENLVQAFARDVVMAQGVQYVDTGRRIAIQTHDELGGVVPDHDAQEAVAVLLQIMKVPPAWAPGLPLSAAGSFASRYGDIEK